MKVLASRPMAMLLCRLYRTRVCSVWLSLAFLGDSISLICANSPAMPVGTRVPLNSGSFVSSVLSITFSNTLLESMMRAWLSATASDASVGS